MPFSSSGLLWSKEDLIPAVLATQPPEAASKKPEILMYRHIRLLAFSVLVGSLVAQTPQPSPRQATSSTPTASKESRDPLLDLPPLPKERVTLLGGILSQLDPVRDQLIVHAFGGKKMRLDFDPRTRFFYNGTPVSQNELKTGQRVYVDTMLNGHKVFAKSVWIETAPAQGEVQGQVVSYEPQENTLVVRDELSAQPAQFHISPSTTITEGKETGSASDLTPGSLVSLTFNPDQSGRVLQHISLLAKPGAAFSFFGNITFIDLAQRVLAIDNQTDSKTYQISVAGLPENLLRTLHEGTTVGVSAVFDGGHYVARTIEPAANDSAVR
jgi:hypothetical protein